MQTKTKTYRASPPRNCVCNRALDLRHDRHGEEKLRTTKEKSLSTGVDRLRISIVPRPMPSPRRSSAGSPPKIEALPTSNHQELLSGFVRLHILHHAAKAPLVGFWIIEELARHGYQLSPGTLYPMLRGMERRGYLRAGALHRAGRRTYRPYAATQGGKEALKQAKDKLRELFHELIEEENRGPKKRTKP